MKGSTANITQFMQEYIKTDEDGYECISSSNVKKAMSDLPHQFNNIVTFIEDGKIKGQHFFVVRSMRTRTVFYKVFIDE